MFLKQLPLCESWRPYLLSEFDKDYMLNLDEFLSKQIKEKRVIYPKPEEYFAAFNFTKFEDVKVVIIGQDPYHGTDKGTEQAHGLSFSVPNGVKIPPSLRNIYKELETDLNIKPTDSGNLTNWARQGVLLLNATLTVEASKAGSHQRKGWEKFTDEVIGVLNHRKDHLVFILWGSYAQKKGNQLDRSRHLVLESAHPSPLSAYRGFFGSRPFSKANKYLASHKITPIAW